jgi:radical SAM superfamily enzyme YgiQ (UPF0313 family)
MRILILNPPNKTVKNAIRDLIYGCWCSGKRIGGSTTPPLNLLYIATVLKQAGHDVELLDAMAEGLSIENVKSRIGKFDIVATSITAMSFKDDSEVLADLKKENPSLKTIVFGSHPTFMPEYCFAGDAIDIIVRHEPEFIIRDLVQALSKDDGSWKDIKGIGYMQDGKPVINEPYPFIEDLDSIPFPDRTMLPKGIDYFNPIVKRMPYATMMTSRGCAARCNFCTVSSFYGKKTRTRSVENILQELELIQSQGYKEVIFRDETFTLFKERNRKVCEGMIERGIDLTWVANARVGTVSRDMAELMKKAGCHLIKMGVESGSQNILDNIHKGTTIEQARDTFKLLKEVGIDTHAHMMLGCPGEDHETIEATNRFIREIDPSTATFGICTPYPGTELFDSVVKQHPEIHDGSDRTFSSVHTSSYFNQYFTDLNEDELQAFLKKAYRSFYLRPSYVFKRLRRINSTDELMRVVIAGTNVVSFSLEKGQG